MKWIFPIVALLCSAIAHGQDLPDNPKSQRGRYYSPEALKLMYVPLTERFIGPGTPIREGMVWHAEDEWWVARPVNSCSMCGLPMTFGQALFNRKTIEMWGVNIALQTVGSAVTERRYCFHERTCQFGNPLFGMTSFKEQASVSVPITLLAWLTTAAIRKGNIEFYIGGFKQWWIVPMAFQGATAGGIIANLVRH